MSLSMTWCRRPLTALSFAALLTALFSQGLGCASSDDLPEDSGRADAAVPDASGGGGDDVGVPDAAAPDVGDAGPVAECDVFAPTCPDGEKCVPLPANGVPICVLEGTQNAPGSACQTYDECEEGSACASYEGLTACLVMCDPQADEALCAEGTYCGKTLGSNPDIGLCVPEPVSCDIYTQDCDAPQACILTSGRAGVLGAFCGQAGELAQGELCSGGLGRCDVGMICVSIGGTAEPTCQPVCRNPSDGQELACPAGLQCDGFTTQSNITFCL